MLKYIKNFDYCLVVLSYIIIKKNDNKYKNNLDIYVSLFSIH